MNKELANTVLFVIDQTTKATKQYAQKEFDLLGIGITVEQWVLLKVIEENNGLSQNELAKATHRDPASITRTLDILVKKNWVLREPIPENRRQYHIRLTQAGADFVVQHMPMVTGLRNTSIKGFSKTEIETLLTLLRKIQKNVE
jgi:MarR family transcriptional regulator, transcriptional regulator for hemolysin